MNDHDNGHKSSIQNASEFTCCDCGKTFIFRKQAQEMFTLRGWALPKRCPQCRMAVRKQWESENERIENEKWQQNKAENQKLFDVRLKEWQVVDIDSIRPRSDNVLYVIGNGFDLMHGVRSDYYSFRNSLGVTACQNRQNRAPCE